LATTNHRFWGMPRVENVRVKRTKI
jgi:hypothetical protein